MEKNDVLRMRVTGREKEAFEEAAKLTGLTFSTWARAALRRTATREFLDAGRRFDFNSPTENGHAGH